MPAHIVLPNGMWRFVKSGSKKAKASVTKRVKRRKVKVKRSRGVSSMAKRRFSKRSRSMISGSGGLAKSALIGIGAAHLAGYVPFAMPYKEEAAGAIGAYLIGGKNIKSAAVGAAAVFLTKMASGNSGTAQQSVSGY